MSNTGQRKIVDDEFEKLEKILKEFSVKSEIRVVRDFISDIISDLHCVDRE